MNTIEYPESITIGGVEYKTDLSEALSINEADLNFEFCRQAELFAYYSTGYELALFEASKQELFCKRLGALLDHNGRMEAKSAGLKFTEAMADNYVKGHKDYLAEHEKLLELQRVTGLLKHAKDAIVQKRDMLKELGQTQRQERGSDLSMKAGHVQHTVFK